MGDGFHGSVARVVDDSAAGGLTGTGTDATNPSGKHGFEFISCECVCVCVCECVYVCRQLQYVCVFAVVCAGSCVFAVMCVCMQLCFANKLKHTTVVLNTHYIIHNS